MEDLEERRRRLAAMREQADAQTADDDTVSSIPSLGAPLLSNPLEDSSADAADAAAVEVKQSSNFDFYTDPLAGYSGSKRRKPGVGVLLKPSQAPLSSSNASRPASAGLLPPPPDLQPAGMFPNPGSSIWQPIVYQPPFSSPEFAHSQPHSGWQPVGYQQPYANPAFAHPQHPPPQLQPQFPPHNMNQWSNQTSGRGRGRGGDREFSGRYNGRQSPNSPAGDSWRDGRRSEGRGAHGRGQGGGRIVSAKEQPHLFVKKSMLEDPWQALQANKMERT